MIDLDPFLIVGMNLLVTLGVVLYLVLREQGKPAVTADATPAGAGQTDPQQ
jgi:hypothetical protein